MDHGTIVVDGGRFGAAIAYGLGRPALPGAFALGCHSGVILASAIAAGALPGETMVFRAERFDVPNSAAA